MLEAGVRTSRQYPTTNRVARRGLAVALLAAAAVTASAAACVAGQLDGAATAAMLARGVVRPVNEATISTDLQARVASIGFKEGAAFKAGDVLIEFDCRQHRAELAAADAQKREMELSLDNNLVLNQHRAIGKHEVEISRARVDKAAGEAEALRARVDQCRIVAPFSGRIAELAIHVHEVPPSGKSFLRIIEDTALEIELIMPSESLIWLRTEQPFAFVVDELKRALPARVTRIGASVDPISQTVKVMARFESAEGLADVLAGMSGAAQFPAQGG